MVNGKFLLCGYETVRNSLSVALIIVLSGRVSVLLFHIIRRNLASKFLLDYNGGLLFRRR